MGLAIRACRLSMSTSQYLTFTFPGLVAIECHEAGLDVEVFISFDD